MRRTRVVGVVCVAVSMALLVGCEDSSAPSAGRQQPQLRTLKPETLPKLGEPISSLDDGRVNVAGPASWIPASRDSSYLVRFKATRTLKYPTIIVTAEDDEGVVNVTQGNVVEFAGKVASELSGRQEAQSSADVIPLKVGSWVGVMYTGRGKAGTTRLDRLFVVTVRDGRRYIVELRTLTGELDKHRNRAIAVAEGIQYVKTPAEEPTEAIPTEGQAETPAGASDEQPPDETNDATAADDTR